MKSFTYNIHFFSTNSVFMDFFSMFWPVFLLFVVLLLEGLGDDVNINDVDFNDGNDPVNPSPPVPVFQKKPEHEAQK